jgi:LVIVD repeat-containing protein
MDHRQSKRHRRTGVPSLIRRGVPVTLLAVASLGASAAVFASGSDPVPASTAQAGVKASLFKDVGRADCRRGDLEETGLQGQVPVADRLSGRAALGYNCNLYEIGAWGSQSHDISHTRLSGWANFDTYKHCAYFHDGSDGLPGGGGTVVLDVSNPRRPVRTAYLTTGAMQGAWESLRVNAKRGLLVADHQPSNAGGDEEGTSPLDIYDISKNCAKPELLFSGPMPIGVGHEGWFQPDGNVYYMSSTRRVVPVDISDPRNPKELAVWDITGHGGSVSPDGKRGYFCDINSREVIIADTSEVAARKTDAQYREISRLYMPGSQWCQETYPISYHGRPYLVGWGEIGDGDDRRGRHCPSQEANYARPIIWDIRDERNPKLVSVLQNEVGEPENCGAVSGDGFRTNNPNAARVTILFLYGTHMCHPDRLNDPTLLACAEFHSGVRVYDISNPTRPREIAYFNPGSLSPDDPNLDMAASRPVIRPELGQIWYSSLTDGFHVLQFDRKVLPKRTLRCATQGDWLVPHYSPGVKRCGRGARSWLG